MRAGVDSELCEQPRDMKLYGAHTDGKQRRDFLVGEIIGDGAKNFSFTRAEGDRGGSNASGFQQRCGASTDIFIKGFVGTNDQDEILGGTKVRYAINGEGAGNAVEREFAVLIGVNGKFGGTGFLVAEYV